MPSIFISRIYANSLEKVPCNRSFKYKHKKVHNLYSLQNINPSSGIIVSMTPHEPSRTPNGTLLKDFITELTVHGLYLVHGQVKASKEEAEDSTRADTTNDVEKLVYSEASGCFELAENLDGHDAPKDREKRL